MDISFILASAEISINFDYALGFLRYRGLERGYGTMTFVNTVRTALDCL